MGPLTGNLLIAILLLVYETLLCFFFYPKIQMFPRANSNKLKLTQMQVYNANDLSNKTNSVRPDLNPEPLAKQSPDHEWSGPLTPT